MGKLIALFACWPIKNMHLLRSLHFAINKLRLESPPCLLTMDDLVMHAIRFYKSIFRSLPFHPMLYHIMIT